MKSIAEIIHQKTFPLKLLDSKSNQIYYEISLKTWRKRQYDSNSNQIYYEDSNGLIIDTRE